MTNFITKRILSEPVRLIMLDQPPAALCALPYPGHPKGCPNLGKAARCPPNAPMYKGSETVRIAAIQYNLAARAEELKEDNPHFTNRQSRCCLYWQGTVRKALREHIREHYDQKHQWEGTSEARGANVFAMMEAAGYPMDRKVENYVWKVAFNDIESNAQPDFLNSAFSQTEKAEG